MPFLSPKNFSLHPPRPGLACVFFRSDGVKVASRGREGPMPPVKLDQKNFLLFKKFSSPRFEVKLCYLILSALVVQLDYF